MGANPPGIRPPHTAPGPTASHVCKGDRHPPVRTGPRASEEKAGRPAGPPDPSAAPPTPPPASPLALALWPSRHSPCSQGPLRHMLTHTHTHSHTFTLTPMHTHTQPHTHAALHAHTHPRSLTHSHTITHTLTHTHMLTHIYTHSHTHATRPGEQLGTALPPQPASPPTPAEAHCQC